MSNGMCIALIAAGAILRFALTVRSPHGLNVHVAGIILICAGVLGLILSFLSRLPRRRGRRSAQPLHGRRRYVRAPARADRPQYDDRPI